MSRCPCNPEIPSRVQARRNPRDPATNTYEVVCGQAVTVGVITNRQLPRETNGGDYQCQTCRGFHMSARKYKSGVAHSGRRYPPGTTSSQPGGVLDRIPSCTFSAHHLKELLSDGSDQT